MSFGVRSGLCLVAATVLGACTSHRPVTVADQFVVGTPGAAAGHVGGRTGTNLAVLPPLPHTNEAVTLERRDPELLAARLALAVAPTAEHHRRVAEAYARLGVRDAAYNHFTEAIRLSRNDAASYDGRARVWRDWGFSNLGLSDVYQAIHYAPKSAAPQNTLGTLLLKLGLLSDARTAFERALALDPGAGYARSNLCYVSRLEHDDAGDAGGCEAQP